MSESSDQPVTAGIQQCLNCGTTLQGKYCYACGQKDLPMRQTTGDLFTNFVGSFTSFESKFFVTMRHLLFAPGRLTNAYINGRREQYYHPARMYAFLSFIFFLLFFAINTNDREMYEASAKYMPDEPTGLNIGRKIYNPPFETEVAYDSAQQVLPPAQRDGMFDRYMNKKAIRFNAGYRRDKVAAVQKTSSAFLETLPKLFFLLLPVFAVLLKLLYWRRDFYYSEHFVFSVHFYSFSFVVGTLGLVLMEIPYLDWISTVLLVTLFVYLFFAVRKVYRQNWWKTGLKFVLLCFTFGMAIIAAIVVNAIVSIMMI